MRFSLISTAPHVLQVALAAVAEVLTDAARVVAAHERAQTARAWRLYSRSVVKGAASEAFRWMKQADVAPITAACERPECVLARPRREYATMWAATELSDDHPSIRAAAFQRLAPISHHDVARALTSFPANTALTKGFGPRILSQASPGLHVIIAALLTAAELVGSSPEGLRRVYVPLIPKASGGHRPIRLYAIFARVWHRVRQPLVRSWWQSLYGAAAWLNTRVGANPCDVVWRDATRAATLRPRGSFTLCVLSDIAKCFENVAWLALQAAAHADGYPSALLRL